MKKVTLPLLPKMATGIQGFDELSHGGLTLNRTSLPKQHGWESRATTMPAKLANKLLCVW